MTGHLLVRHQARARAGAALARPTGWLSACRIWAWFTAHRNNPLDLSDLLLLDSRDAAVPDAPTGHLPGRRNAQPRL